MAQGTRTIRPAFAGGAVLLALCIGLALGLLLAPDNTPDQEPEPAQPTATAPAAAPPSEPSPTPVTGPTEETGCTQESAVASAVEWLQRFTSELYLDDEARQAAVTEVAASSAEAELQRITTSTAERLREAGLTPEIAAAAVRVVLPAGYRLVSLTEASASVAVWTAAVAELGEVVPLRTSWDTQTTTMACEDDRWRLVSIDTEEGPVPDMAAQGDGQLPETLEAIQSFTEFDHEP